MYRFVEHTADIAIEVYGKTVEELFRNATLAFRDAFVFPEKVKGEEKREITVKLEGESEEEKLEYALYDWLNELLYLFDAEHFAALDVKVKVDGDVKGELKGGKLSSEAVKVEPKAITLHKFKVEKNDFYKAFFIVDI